MSYSYRVQPGGRRVKIADESPHPGADATIAEVLAWVGEDRARAHEARLYEVGHRTGEPRSTLLAKLEVIARG